MRSTHTFVELNLSAAAYEEIARKLKEADYDHAFMEDGAIDMHGIGVVREGDKPAGRELPLYRSYKNVHALQIATIGVPMPDHPVHVRCVSFLNHGYPPLNLSSEMFLRYQPVPGDYYVVYADGYQSFSPKKAFEEGYKRIDGYTPKAVG